MTSFVDLMGNDVWSEADIKSRLHAMIRARFSEQVEAELSRSVMGAMLGQHQITPQEGAAIAAFKARADVVAEAMGKKYRIKQMNIHTNSRGPQPLYRAANKSMLMEAAAPMPVEGGESAINATVTGQIELE